MVDRVARAERPAQEVSVTGRKVGRGLACALTVFGLASMGLSASAQAQSDDDARARTHFEAGRSYFEEGAYDRAREEFQRAYDLSRRPPLLLNVATADERLGRYAEAAANIRRYLEAVPDDPNRTTLERRIQNLERLDAERRRAGGGESGERADRPDDAEDGANSSAPAPASSGRGMDDGLLAGTIAGYGVAGAGAVLMAIFGAMALAEDSALASGCGAVPACTPDDVADANTFALVSDIGLGVALAGAVAGTVLLVLGATSGPSDEQAAITPWVAPDAGGVAARIRF